MACGSVACRSFRIPTDHEDPEDRKLPDIEVMTFDEVEKLFGHVGEGGLEVFEEQVDDTDETKKYDWK